MDTKIKNELKDEIWKLNTSQSFKTQIYCSLRKAGINSLEDLRTFPVKKLLASKGIGIGTLEMLYERDLISMTADEKRKYIAKKSEIIRVKTPKGYIIAMIRDDTETPGIDILLSEDGDAENGENTTSVFYNVHTNGICKTTKVNQKNNL